MRRQAPAQGRAERAGYSPRVAKRSWSAMIACLCCSMISRASSLVRVMLACERGGHQRQVRARQRPDLWELVARLLGSGPLGPSASERKTQAPGGRMGNCVELARSGGSGQPLHRPISPSQPPRQLRGHQIHSE